VFVVVWIVLFVLTLVDGGVGWPCWGAFGLVLGVLVAIDWRGFGRRAWVSSTWGGRFAKGMSWSLFRATAGVSMTVISLLFVIASLSS
jgi:hypothetical protein